MTFGREGVRTGSLAGWRCGRGVYGVGLGSGVQLELVGRGAGREARGTGYEYFLCLLGPCVCIVWETGRQQDAVKWELL